MAGIGMGLARDAPGAGGLAGLARGGDAALTARFGIVVTSREMKSDATGHPVVTRDGDRFWATAMEEGWVEATSARVTDQAEAPADLLTFETEAKARAFGKRWKGHPWWCSPQSFEVVGVTPRMMSVRRGWTIVRRL
jgi:hypothetical protein